MPLRLQQNRRNQPRAGKQTFTRSKYGCYQLRNGSKVCPSSYTISTPHTNNVRSLDYLIDRMWEELSLVKIYTKKRGAHPDLSDPICLRKGATIEDVCNGVHRSLVTNFKYAVVW